LFTKCLLFVVFIEKKNDITGTLLEVVFLTTVPTVGSRSYKYLRTKYRRGNGMTAAEARDHGMGAQAVSM
jgi:hypothetical protein